jgi:hypothetical protein
MQIDAVDLFIDHDDAIFIRQMAAYYNTEPAVIAGDILMIGLTEKKEATIMAKNIPNYPAAINGGL